MNPINDEKKLKNFLNTKNFYLNDKKSLAVAKASELDLSDVAFYRVKSITFKKDSPERQALENVLSALRIDGIYFISLILGDKDGVEFYYGIARDYSKKASELNIKELGKSILQPSIEGNFRGSKVEAIQAEKKREILDKIQNNSHHSMIDGVPGILQDEDTFQGVERLVDAMSSEEAEFGLMTIASLMNDDEVLSIENDLFEIYSLLSPYAKQNIQNTNTINTGESDSYSTNENITRGESSSTTTGTSSSKTLAYSTNKSKSISTGVNESHSKGRTDSLNETYGNSKSQTVSYNTNQSKSESVSTSENHTRAKNESRGTNTSSSKNTGSSDGGDGWSTSEGKSTSRGTSKTIGSSESDTYGGSKSQNTSYSSGSSKGSSTSTNESHSKGRSDSINETYGNSKSESISDSTGSSKSSSTSTNESQTFGKNESQTSGSTNTKGTNKGESNASGLSHELINKKAQDWLKYIDDILLPRIDYGKGKGLFVSSMLCFSNSKSVLTKLENTAISLFSGENGNKVPLRAQLLKDENALKSFKNLQLPQIKTELIGDLQQMRSLYSQSAYKLGNIISSKELSLIAGLPKKEVMGLELDEEIEFGLNFKQSTRDPLILGHLIKSGNQTNKEVSIDKANLDKHIFITGVTGSGKTTTCQNILKNAQKPFLVIEPAKTEYRILKREYEDLLIFSLGKDTLTPFRLNPFEFFKHESITSRVDMIRASIEAAFDMEAAIPQIIESAIYKIYKDKGWNINTNQNEIYGDKAFDEGVYAFPTLQDLYNRIEKEVKSQGFDDRLKNDYIGSIKARLNGLLVGSKGLMLNTKRSIDFRKLLNARVVLEIEEIRNGNEKSLIMGFILGNLLEAIKANFFESKEHGIKHIILIEEAHRLLSKYQPGDSANKKQGVEFFADMLAEIRKYGESLIIADQIPNKLTPEVLKNTNTKIVHRIFAADDKEAIANTMALEKEQTEFLSKLETGVAIVFSSGFNKAVATKITQSSNTTSNELITEEELQKNIYEFYAKEAKSGVILGSAWLENVGVDKIKLLLDLQRRKLMQAIKQNYYDEQKQKVAPKLLESLKEVSQHFDKNFLARYFLLENDLKEEKLNSAIDFISKYLNNSLNKDDVQFFKDDLF